MITDAYGNSWSAGQPVQPNPRFTELQDALAAATSRAERAERERDQSRHDLDALTALLLDIGEAISPTGEWPPEAIGQLPAAVEQLDSRAERAEAAIQRVDSYVRLLESELDDDQSDDDYSRGRFAAQRQIVADLQERGFGTDNTGGTAPSAQRRSEERSDEKPKKLDARALDFDLFAKHQFQSSRPWPDGTKPTAPNWNPGCTCGASHYYFEHPRHLAQLTIEYVCAAGSDSSLPVDGGNR